MKIRKLCLGGGLALLGWIVGVAMTVAQPIEREYVVGIGDVLNIQVYNQVQLLANFSGQMEVRLDQMITLPWLGDVKVAGLKKSTLTKNLESADLLGKYLKEPHVTIAPTRIAPNIRVVFSGVFPMEQEVSRESRLTPILNEFLPQLQQYHPDVQAIRVRSFEGEEFSVNENPRLQWGDEIIIPSLVLPTPTPIPLVSPKLPPATFTPDQYQQFLEFLQAYPADLETLKTVVSLQEDAVILQLDQLSEDQQEMLQDAVLDELMKYTGGLRPDVLLSATLLEIMVNLTVEGLHEAFLAIPEPSVPEGVTIKTFRPGDVVQPGATDAEDIILAEIQPELNQIRLQKGNTSQTLSLAPKFSTVILSGILNIGGEREVVLSNTIIDPVSKLGLRKRFKPGDHVEADIVLADIVPDQKMVVLRKGPELQLVFLRDPRKRPAPEPPTPASPEVMPIGEDGQPIIMPEMPPESQPSSVPVDVTIESSTLENPLNIEIRRDEP